MERISADLVKRIADHMRSLQPADTPPVIKAMSMEQPVLFAYLMAIGKGDFDQSEQELILDLGVTIWQIMKQGAESLSPLAQETLSRVEKRNLAMLQYLQSEPESEFENTVKLVFQHYNQPEVLRYVLDAIMEESPGKTPVSDENKGLVLYYLKNLIDALDAETTA